MCTLNRWYLLFNSYEATGSVEMWVLYNIVVYSGIDEIYIEEVSRM